jgi:hypothetical protein
MWAYVRQVFEGRHHKGQSGFWFFRYLCPIVPAYWQWRHISTSGSLQYSAIGYATRHAGRGACFDVDAKETGQCYEWPWCSEGGRSELCSLAACYGMRALTRDIDASLLCPSYLDRLQIRVDEGPHL